jgi:hypothetical protein
MTIYELIPLTEKEQKFNFYKSECTTYRVKYI